MTLPRLGEDILHPDELDRPTRAELAPWVRAAKARCKSCAGTGHEYGERGLFRRCPCRVPLDAPEKVVVWLRKELYQVF